jgi:hypothetical protein
MEKPSTPLISPASHTQSESLSIPVLSTSLTNISEFPSSVQENILIEELLYCLLVKFLLYYNKILILVFFTYLKRGSTMG